MQTAKPTADDAANNNNSTLTVPMDSDIRIIINGIADKYNGGAFYIDDSYVLNHALTEDECKVMDKMTTTAADGKTTTSASNIAGGNAGMAAIVRTTDGIDLPLSTAPRPSVFR